MSAPVYRRGRSCFTLRYAIRWRVATAVLLHRDVWLLHRRADRPGEQPVGPTATAHLQGPAVRRSARQTPLGRPADPIENDRQQHDGNAGLKPCAHLNGVESANHGYAETPCA